MRLYIFKSTRVAGVQAFSVDEDGANLPEEHAPWASLGSAMTAGDLSADDRLAASIQACGYYVVEARDDGLRDGRVIDPAKLSRARDVSATVQTMLAILENAALGGVEGEVTSAASLCVALAAKWQLPPVTMMRYLTDYLKNAESFIDAFGPASRETLN